jgi:hypothetical protein
LADDEVEVLDLRRGGVVRTEQLGPALEELDHV